MSDNKESYNSYCCIYADTGVDFSIGYNAVNCVTIPHLHPRHEFYYNISGGEYFFIGNKFISVKPHDLVIIPSLQIHKAVRNINTDYEAYIINVTDYILNTVYTLPMLGEIGHTYSKFDISAIGKTKPYTVHLNQDQHEKIIKLFAQCQAAEQSNNNMLTLLKYVEIQMFIEELYEHTEINENELCTPQTWSEKTMLYIENHLGESFNIENIANALYVDRSHLTQSFKAETHIPLNKYITLRKIAESQKLMYLGYNISESSKKAGFKSLSYFTQVYKHENGYLPSDFMKLPVNKF